MTKTILSLILILWTISVSSVWAQTTRALTASQDLDAGTLDFTTAFGTLTSGCLSQVVVNFTAAPESAETVNVYQDSRKGTKFDSLLFSASTVAGTTKNLTFLFYNGVPVNSDDQIRVTVTNNSQSASEPNDDPTVDVVVLVDTTVASCQGTPFTVIRDGTPIASGLKIRPYQVVANSAATDEYALTYEASCDCFEWQLISSGGYATVQDEGTALTQRTTLNFTGDGVTCSDDGVNSRTTCNITVGAGTGDITDIGACTTGACATDGGNDMFPFVYEGTADANEITFTATNPTADRTIVFPDASGEVTLLGQTNPALLGGRAGGQTLRGGTGASENLTLESTNNATKGLVVLAPGTGDVGINTTSFLGGIDTPERATLEIVAPSDRVHLNLVHNNVDAHDARIGIIHFLDPNSTGDKRLGSFQVNTDGGTANNRGGQIILGTKVDGGGATSIAGRVWVKNDGKVGINTSTPDGLLDVENGGIYVSEIAAPPTPNVGKGVLYEKTDNMLYFKNDAGTEFNLTAGGASNFTFVRKTANETVNNSSVLQNDDHLHFSVTANTNYFFRMRLRISSGTTPDFKAAITVPTGTTLSWSIINPTTTGLAFTAPVDITTSGNSQAVGTNTTISGNMYLIEGIALVGATAGTLQLQWAQNTATASDTTVFANSYLYYRVM